MMRHWLLILGLNLAGLIGCAAIDGDDSAPIIRDGCHVGGCSAQACSDDPDIVTTCEWLPEYECYGAALCERQESGSCDWTPTVELTACIADARD